MGGHPAARSLVAVGRLMRRPPGAPCRQAGGRRLPSAAGGTVPDRDADPGEPEDAAEPDWRRLLDGYAEPGRIRRLKDRQRRQQAARRCWLRPWLRRLLRRRSR
jgi:hypothetical protein